VAVYYWVGTSAGGTWDSTTTTFWSLTSGGSGSAGVPTSADDVIFDRAGSIPVTLNAAGLAVCKSISITAGSPAFSGSGGISIYGSTSFLSTASFSNTGSLQLNGTTAGNTFSQNGASITSGIVQNGTGAYTLGSALSCGLLTITFGTFDTNNFSVSCAGLSSSNTNTRSITLGSSSITSAAAASVNFGTSTGLTFNAGTSTITCTLNAVSFTGGAKTFYNVIASSTAANGGFAINNFNSFNNLTVSAPTAPGSRFLNLNAAQTVTGTLTTSGTTPTNRIIVQSSTSGVSVTFSVAALASFVDVDFRDINATGAANWAGGTRIGDCTNNTGITFSSPKTVYWNLAGAQNISATGWALTSGGTPGVNNFPLAQDVAAFDNVGSLTGVLTQDSATYNIGAFDFSARTSAATMISSGNLTLYKYFANAPLQNIAVALIFEGSNAKTISMQGTLLNSGITINGIGSLTLLDALKCAVINLSRGTLDTAGMAVTSTGFSSTSAVTRTLTLGATTWISSGTGTAAWNTNSTNITINPGTSTISLTSATAKTFTGGIGNTYYNINQGGAGTLSIVNAMTFNDIQNSYVATGAATITLQGSPLTVANFTATGAAGKVLTLNSSAAGTARTLTKTGGGTISVDYMSIQDSTAAGTGATWYAGANSTDLGNNTGWIFTAPPPNSRNFFLMFQ
jgi:hypothetical protein